MLLDRDREPDVNAETRHHRGSQPVWRTGRDATVQLVYKAHAQNLSRPGRVMEAQYHGGGLFEVIYSERTRLRRGTSFRCFLIINNQPMFVTDVVTDDQSMSAYVCGNVNGVQFEVIPVKPPRR